MGPCVATRRLKMTAMETTTAMMMITSAFLEISGFFLFSVMIFQNLPAAMGLASFSGAEVP